MSLNDMGLFKMIARRLDYFGQRQTVLAQNVANANTPDYRPRDLEPFDFRMALRDTRSFRPTTTHEAHLSGTVRGQGPAGVSEDRHPYETKPDGNAVILEEQILKVSQTAMDHGVVSGLYRKQMNMLRSALGGGGGRS